MLKRIKDIVSETFMQLGRLNWYIFYASWLPGDISNKRALRVEYTIHQYWVQAISVV